MKTESRTAVISGTSSSIDLGLARAFVQAAHKAVSPPEDGLAVDSGLGADK